MLRSSVDRAPYKIIRERASIARQANFGPDREIKVRVSVEEGGSGAGRAAEAAPRVAEKGATS